MIWRIIDRFRYPKCGWEPCGNSKDNRCTKLTLKKYVDCKKNMRAWGRYI